ncbi:hypothetical protein N7450_003835 [Penicillium hetheringtonii]|uniref:Mitochondrial division protein 1 n=1 Tax=Penicillium hetheringtonii TaxID=911720 RepID=A0AAD6DNY4_9EURO|nr:hypothetical protein N7450_003835 [Penicillium hetheringtonii]
MDDAQSRIRRRESRAEPVVESPLDESAHGSDHEAKRRRTSWSQRDFTSEHASPNKRDYDESDSQNELGAGDDGYWHGSRSRRSPSPINRPTPSEQMHEDRSPNESDDLSEDRLGRDDEKHRSTREDMSDRSTSPVQPAAVEPPPPSKPESLNYKEKRIFRGISTVQFSPDCSMIASGGSDAVIKVWDTLTGKLIYTFEGHLAGISTLAWSPDGQWIASGSDDKTIRFWNVKTGRAHTKPFIGHHNYVYQIAFAPKGNILVSGSYDEAVFMWDVRRARVMRSLPAHSDPVAGIDVVHDGTLIVSCAHDGLVRVWDTHSGQCLRTLVHEDNPPATCVKFSPNGKYILAWTLDGCIRMWNYVESRVVKTFQGHVNNKYSLSGCFGLYGSPDVKYSPPPCFAVSGSEDGDILCWDIVSKNILQRIKGHTETVLCVHTGKLNGKRLMVSCGLDLTIRLWEEVDEDNSKSNSTPLVNGAADSLQENEDKEMVDAPLDPSAANTPALDVTMT